MRKRLRVGPLSPALWFLLLTTITTGVFAAALALGFLSISQVLADVGGPGAGDIPAVTVDPDTAGAVATHVVTFWTASDLTAGLDTITIQFEDDVGVPTVIDPSNVFINASHGTNRSGGATGPLLANPISVTTALVGVPADETEVTLLIGDMSPGEAGSQGIAGLPLSDPNPSEVVIVFIQAAGLTNPTEGTKDYKVKVKTSQDTTFVDSTTYNIPREVLLNDDDGNRGKTVTAIGRGFQNGTTATLWLDTDKDGIRDATETVLGTGLVGSDDTFTVSFVINVPPFAIGATPNHIRAIDGQNNTDDGTVATYLIEGLMTVTPEEAAVGDTVTVNIKDWPVDEDPTALSQFTLGGVNIFTTLAALTGAVSITAGEDSFTFDVPDGVTLGSQELKFSTASESDRAVMNILGAGLEITPDGIAPNQTVTIQGQGYTDTGFVFIDNSADSDSKMTIAGVRIIDANIDQGAPVQVDSSGNWVASVVIPVSSVTSEPGTYDFKVFDSAGREGVTTITMLPRVVTVSPPESGPFSTITVNGSGYPALNFFSPQFIGVTVRYSGSGFPTFTVSGLPDASGDLQVTMPVPPQVGQPSTNTVTVEYTYTDPTSSTTFTVTDIIIHRVPGPIVCGDVHPEGSGDSDVDVFDALRTLNIAVGSVVPSGREQTAGDVHPDNNPDPDGDGSITVLDAQRVLGAVLGNVVITSCGG